MSLEIDSEKEYTERDDGKISTFRRFFAQFIAATIKNMLLFDLGMCTSFAGIIIPALTDIKNDQNQDETLTLSSVQASWIGSIAFICEPLGSILSALITDPLGRKRAMILVNIPITIAWLMLYQSSAVWHIFVANILLGIGVGLMESPVVTYIGEVCEPKYRGILIAYTSVCGTLGALLVFSLNTLMPWRSVALACMAVPILTMIAVCFVPETPMWLLSKNRIEDAENSLRWLRGWVPRDAISKEFQELQRYSEHSKSCSSCIKLDRKCTHPPPTLLEKLAELKRKPTLKPLFIVVSLFVIAEFTGSTGMGPYNVQIFKAYKSPMAPDQATAVLSSLNNVANITFLCLIRFTGKRYLYLTMLAIVVLCSAIVSAYGFIYLPNGYNSFDHSQQIPTTNETLSYIPFVCIMLWNFCSFCGVNSVPWQMISEIYPFKVRSTYAGFSAAIDYILSFISTKSYYNLETLLSMPGISLLNCTIAAVGLVLMYFILPETENKSLEDIEVHFSDNSKKLTDRKIVSVKSKLKNGERSREMSKFYDVPEREQHEIDDFELKNRLKTGCDNRGFVSGV